MAAGILQVVPVPNQWVAVGSPDCEELIFEEGEFDLADKADPGGVFFHVTRGTGALKISTGGAGGIFWLRSVDADPITFIWTAKHDPFSKPSV